jgi:Leucine-rich repeat (LRR) protein
LRFFLKIKNKEIKMANQLNPVKFPLNLVNQTASFIITRDLQNSEDIDEGDRSDVNRIIAYLWSKLKHSPQDYFDLKHTVLNIEESFVKEQQKAGKFPSTFSIDLKDDLIANNINILFKNLAKKFQAERVFGNHVPTDISSYEYLQRIWEDDALQTIWNLHLRELFVFNEQSPTSLDEIKAWLKDPANAMQLSAVRTLNLSGLGLRAIPPEISALTQLQELFLKENQICSVPESLSNLSHLKKLYLCNNQISSIPDSFSKLSQLRIVHLKDNRIKNIPNSFASLSQLQLLSFGNNEITSIPDLLSSLSELSWLDLSNNKIINIPDSLAHFSRLLQLVLLGNPLLFIYDKSPVPDGTSKLVVQYSEFKQYKCLSSFSNLCQLVVLKNDNHEIIKEAFGNLKKNDKNLIFEMTYKESGVNSSNDPISWGEHHVFDNMNIFYHAIKKAIAEKFDRLSLEEKNAVYGEINQLAQPETKDPKWGKSHVFDNVLRLIDAMDRVGS